jgi:hypothetical protein
MIYCLLVLLVSLVNSSELNEFKGTTEGDQDLWFITCWKQCFQQLGCSNSSVDNEFGMSVYISSCYLLEEKSKSLALTLTFWNCEDECKYVCARKHSKLRIDSGLNVVQYYGKWPFIRVSIPITACDFNELIW